MKTLKFVIAGILAAGILFATANAQEIVDVLAPIPEIGQIRQAMEGKTMREKRDLKARVIARAAKKGTFTDTKYGVTMEIVSVSKIEDGMQVFVKAWKNGKQLGFGSDGTTEIERFRFFNPPILVDDPLGTIVNTVMDPVTNMPKVRRMKEDPFSALKQSLAHTISITGRTDTNIVRGKIGNTTDTFYSDTGGDGFIEAANGTYATAQAAAVGTVIDVAAFQFGQQKHSNGNFYIWRGFFPFDTSAITDTDTVSSATFSIFGTNKLDSNSVSPVATVVSNAQSVSTLLATTDFNDLGTTGYATITYASWSTSAYNDFTLDSNGLAQISLTGYSKFGLRTDKDISATAPASNHTSQLYGYSANETGTTSDPKLVIVHAAAGGGGTPVNKKKPVIIIQKIIDGLVEHAYAL